MIPSPVLRPGLAALVLLLAASASAEEWNRETAARYLDARAETWTHRSRARQKLQTACVSCHTALPYLLSRGALGDAEPARVLFTDVESRVRDWGSIDVWYDASRGAEKPAQSWATESVLNALVLTLRDRSRESPLTEESRLALDHMWSQQDERGAWNWLHFGLGPWETDGSDYWAACLAGVAAMSAASEHTPPPERLDRLRGFLRAGWTSDLSLHNRIALLWASSTWPSLLGDDEADRLVTEVVAAQRGDGGFRLVDLGPWPSKDGTPPGASSDGYATAFTTFVLQQVQTTEAAASAARGVSWLERHQEADGRWETLSPNKDRSAEEEFTRLLASDAATGFAVLALTHADSGSTGTQP